jgi:hypothetical protein
MSDLTVELETVIGMARGLSPLEKVRLVEEVMTLLEEDLTGRKTGPRHSLYGLLPNADISAEDIAEAREEMWGNFPHRDV